MEIPFIIIAGLILFAVVAIGALFLVKRKGLEKVPADGKYPKGHFINKWMAIGIPLGLPIGLAMGNISLGLPIGLAIGYAIGASMEEKNKDKIRPLTSQEEERKNTLTKFTLAILIIGVLVLALVFLSTNL
jgi:hypothetical protein